jgi:hypothetical protein
MQENRRAHWSNLTTSQIIANEVKGAMARGDGATRTLRQKRKHDRMKRKSQEVQGMPRRGTALSQKQEQIPL